MKPLPRTIDLVERQIVIAKKNNQPRVLAKLEKELEELEWNRQPKMVATPTKRMANTYNNQAAMSFYGDKRFKLD